jgi:hypothetical protein
VRRVYLGENFRMSAAARALQHFVN